MRLPWRKFLNIVYVDAFQRWVAQEYKQRTSHIADQALRESVPYPTVEEFDMVLDPASAEEQDFIADYV